MAVLEGLRDWWARLRADREAVGWTVFVAAAYGAATFAISQLSTWGPDHMMILATDIATQGRFDLTTLTTANDIVTIDGHYYQAMSLLPTVPYFFLVPFQLLWPFSRWIVSWIVGTIAGSLALPVARRYGPGGSATWWLAALGAFGTMLFTLSIEGDFYYLAHLESVALMFIALIEWKGRRRPAVLGAMVGLALLARPTLVLVAVPVGLALLWDSKDRVRTAIGFAWPIALGILVTGWFDWVRFGSPLETGYGIAWITPGFWDLRAQGMFSLVHLPSNLILFFFGGFDSRSTFPWLVPSNAGHSILLTTPALLIAFNGGFRERTSQVLWWSTLLVAIPVFLYYGGGGANTYGYRYAMDFVPFLFALVAMGLREHFGTLEKVLVAASMVLCCYGYVWHLFK